MQRNDFSSKTFERGGFQQYFAQYPCFIALLYFPFQPNATHLWFKPGEREIERELKHLLLKFIFRYKAFCKPWRDNVMNMNVMKIWGKDMTSIINCCLIFPCSPVSLWIELLGKNAFQPFGTNFYFLSESSKLSKGKQIC